MKKILLAVIMLTLALFSGCSPNEKNEIVPDVKDLSGLDAYQQERETDYRLFFKPKERDGYVGDVMPYYENGIYHLFYLKDEGGSIRHSVYRVDTKDFITFEDKGKVLEAAFSQQQDYWIGTGSIVKVDNDYYFFYTGHNPGLEVWEKVMVAKSEGSLDNFKKIPDFEIAPPKEYNQKDFRDPQVFYDEENQEFLMSVETNSGGVAHMVKFTVSKDLKTVTHDGIFYSDRTYGFWNLECMDIEKVGSKYYLTYSGQNDTVWYAVSDSMFSGYGTPKRLEGKIFYAPKMVSNGSDVFLVGWAARRKEYTDSSELYWGGHLLTHKMNFNSEKVTLSEIDGLEKYFAYNTGEKQEYSFSAGAGTTAEIGAAAESFMITGEFNFTGESEFGFALGNNANRKVGYSSAKKEMIFKIEPVEESIAKLSVQLESGKDYKFRFVMEGSVGILYIGGVGALSIRVYGANNEKVSFYSKGGSVNVKNVEMFLRSKVL